MHRTATLPDHQTKQIEFLNVANIPAERVYVFDGFNPRSPNGQMIYYQWNQQNFGGESNKKVWVVEEFKNSEANHLGMPLPKGRMRFYRRDADEKPQFVSAKTPSTIHPRTRPSVSTLETLVDLTGERTPHQLQKHGQ